MSDTDIVDDERLALLLGWHKARPWHAWADVVSNGEVVMMVRELQRLRSGRRYGGLTVEQIDTKIVGLYATSSTHAFNQTKAEIPANELREIADLWAALLARVRQIDG